MRLLLCISSLLFKSWTVAGDDIVIFKGSRGPVAGSLLFNTDDGSALIDGRSWDPLNFVGAGLDRRQSTCRYPVICSSTTCCPSGTNCCGTGIKCCPTDSNCITNPRDGCCPTTAETCDGMACAESNSVCCGDIVCPSGYTCNTNGGNSCCASDEIKCSGTCCPSGTSCGSAGLCRRQTSSLSTATSTSSRTSTRTRSSSSTSANASPTATSDDCPAQEPQSQLSGCSYECWKGKWLPVVQIPNISGRTDQLYISMCSGIKNTGRVRGTGNSVDWDVLTYAGDGVNAKKRRRRQAKCAGYCTEQKRVFTDPERLECDEYPPAMSSEGGLGAFRTCIPSAQNSGEQGRRLKEFVDRCKPTKGSNFVVRMEGGCSDLQKRDYDSVLPLWARQDNTASSTTFTASGNELRDLGNASSFIYVPFEDLRNGNYHVDASFEGKVTGISILDSDGDQYYTSEDAPISDNGGQKAIDFEVSDIDDGDPMPAALIIDTGASQSVAYTATATITASASSTATSPPGLSSARLAQGELSWKISFAVAGGSMWMMWE